MENLPIASEDLIIILDEMYPKPVITPGVDRDNLMYLAGQRSVVDRLLWLREELSESTK